MNSIVSQNLDINDNFSNDDKNSSSTGPVEQLREIIVEYLDQHPKLSVNAISKKCGVSEPTLRRIVSGKIKTLPQVTTVLDILTYLANTNSVRDLVKKYKGSIAEFLLEAMPYLEQMDQDYSNLLNEELKNPIKYLIYKLAINHTGVREEKVRALYGNHGRQLLEELVCANFLYRDNEDIYRTKMKSFSSSHSDFVRNFKIVADFIKPEKHKNRKPLNPLFVNASESITPEAYEQILRLQRKTQKKIRQILADPHSKGSIPSFFICAFDSLDLKSPFEIAEEQS